MTPEMSEAIYAFMVALVALITVIIQNYKQQKSINEVKTTVNGGQVQTTVVAETTAQLQGQWSDEAKEALEKALPAGYTVVSVSDSPTHHIVQWTVKR